MSRIVVPVDDSPEMNEVAEKALSLAKELGRNLVALYVIDTPRLTKVIPRDQITTAWEPLLDTEGQKVLLKIEENGKRMGVHVETKIVEGIPDDEILKEAKKTDLIVMGCRPYRYIDKLLTSNVCEKVLDHSSASVMTYQIR